MLHMKLKNVHLCGLNADSFMDHTLAGGLALQSHLHHFKQLLIGTSHELLVCSDSDLGILLGGAIQLQQHSSLREGNCCQQLMLDCHSPLPLC